MIAECIFVGGEEVVEKVLFPKLRLDGVRRLALLVLRFQIKQPLPTDHGEQLEGLVTFSWPISVGVHAIGIFGDIHNPIA